MITLHFHLLPQYKYELFHIYFTWFHCMGRYELNKLALLPMCGFIAQLVEHRTGIAEVMGSNPVEALIFFRLLLSSCLNWKIYCDDHISLSFTTAVQIWIISYIFHLMYFDININLQWFHAISKWKNLWSLLPTEHSKLGLFTNQVKFNYRKDSCISRTFLLKFWAKIRGCGLYTRPFLSERVNWLVVATNWTENLQ